jgi:hypothetical protein
MSDEFRFAEIQLAGDDDSVPALEDAGGCVMSVGLQSPFGSFILQSVASPYHRRCESTRHAALVLSLPP